MEPPHLVPSRDADAGLFCFQLLGFAHNPVLIKTFDGGEVFSPKTWLIQPLEIWGSTTPDLPATKLNVFRLSDTEHMLPQEIVSADLKQRCNYKVWKEVPSEVDGTLQLESPTVLSCSLSLSDPKIPVLCLLDVLSERDCLDLDKVQIHTKRSGLFFDRRNVSSKRFYLQCVLSSESIFAKGHSNFRSDQPQDYYKLLMRSSAKLPAKLSAKECATKMKAIAGDDCDEIPAVLDACALKPFIPIADSNALCDKPPATDCDIDGDEMAPPNIANLAQPPSPEPPPVVDEPVPPPSPEPPSQVGIDGGDDEGLHFVTQIHGCTVSKEAHGHNVGMRVSCPVHGITCKAFRSPRLDVHIFGPKAAEYFLGCWIQKAFGDNAMEFEAHKKYRPSRRDIAQYIEQFGQ